MKKKNKIKNEIKLNITAKLKDPKAFDGFHTDWFSGNVGKEKFELLSTAGCGGSKLIFRYKGQTFNIECSDIPRQIVEQIDGIKTEMIHS